MSSINIVSGARPTSSLHAERVPCHVRSRGAFSFLRALLRGLADIYAAVASPPVILVNERKALKQCHVSWNMKSIVSSVAESTEQPVRKHLAAITLTQLVRKVHRVQEWGLRPQRFA